MSAATSPESRARGALALIAMGIATSDLRDVSYDSLKRSLRGALTRDPTDSLLTMVLGGSYLFYLAEKDENPRVSTFLDAVTHISRCLSVGHAGDVAQTEPGKAIASFVMTFGPALAASALDPPPAPPADGALDASRAILGRLDDILEALRSPRAQ